jgi:amino acid transporter
MGSIDHYLGKVGQDIAMVLLCSSIFAAALAMHNITARYLFSMGRDQVFPRQLGSVHESHDSPHVASFVTTVIASLFLAGILITGADGNALYAKLAGIALYALIMLLLLTSAAIPAYFWLRPGHGFSPMKTIVAPVLAGIGFIGALIFATQNASFLVGGSTTAATSLIVFFYVMVLVGVAYALVLKRTRPEVYARIGRQDD